MAMSTRRMEDKGEGKIGDTKVLEKRLVSQGTPNSANDLTPAQRQLDMNKDGDLTGADFEILGNKNKKRMA